MLYKKAFYDKGNGFILCKIKWAEKFTAYCLYDRGKNDLVGKNVYIYIFLFFFKVSWIRRKDYHLLTVGLTTYSSDERFSTIHLQHSEVSPFFFKIMI